MDQPPMKYHHKTRLGNWSEEQELEESKLKDFLKNKEKGSLQSSKLQQKIDTSLLKASLTFSNDGLVHYGDHLMLLNKETDGFLVTDIYDPISGNDEAYNCFTDKNATATSRSVFIIKKYIKEQDLFNDDIVRYGQKIQIQVNPLLTKKELFLHSCHITPQHVAKFSRKQEVGLYAKSNYDTVWLIEHIDPKVRFEKSGSPVMVGDSILLKHCQTAQWLASDPHYPIKNEFGVQYEIFGHSFQTLNKTQNLIAEKSGRSTVEMPSRNQKDQNCWAIVLASSPDEQFDEFSQVKTPSTEDYINKLRRKIIDKGPYGYRNLANQFLKLDTNNSGTISRDEFKVGLKNFGLLLTIEEFNAVFNAFDKNRNGVIDFQEFFATIKGQISPARSEVIRKAWESLSERFGEAITFEKLVQIFDSRNHPEVKRGLKPDKEVFREFTSAWDISYADRLITFNDFFDYYADVSAGYEKDENFSLMLHSVWNFK